jgi:hypothetical protein
MRALLATAAVSALTIAAAGSAAHAATPTDYPVVVGDQGSNRLMAFDPSAPNWNGSPSWSWSAVAPDFSATEITAFGLVSDFKRRNLPNGQQRFVVAASRGLIAEMSYPDGRRVWATTAPGANPHAAELLPDGDVAAAASDGGWIRLYAAATGASTYAQFNLTDAHGVLWDPTVQRLWALGDRDGRPTLVALEVYGSAASPELREDTSRSVTVPTVNPDQAHDLYGDESSPGALWITTNRGVFRYDPATRSITAEQGPPARPGVKSIGVEPSGLMAQTTPHDCTADTWCTPTVDFFSSSQTFSRTYPGAQIYKARVWTPYYTAVDVPARGTVWDRTAGGPAIRVDGNGSIASTSATVLPDGTTHLFTVLPSSGVWERIGSSTGWAAAATHIDTNGSIAATAATPANGVLHLFTVVPGSGVYEKINTGSGWSAATQVDHNGAVTAVAATAIGGTLHLFTVVPGSGAYEKINTGSGWSAATQLDKNGAVSSVAAVSSGSTVHLFTVVSGTGVREATNPGSGWSAAALLAGADGADTTGVSATQDGGVLRLAVVRNGIGVEMYTSGSGTSGSGGWTTTGPTDDPSALGVYAAGPHVGVVRDVS